MQASRLLFLMTSDLESKRWSVISERGCEASSLTHEEARRLVHRLGAEGRHGLCIISDEAARRVAESPVDSEASRIPG